MLAEALKLGLDDARRKAGCLLSAEEANSAAMKILFEPVVVRDHWPTAADIILYDRKAEGFTS